MTDPQQVTALIDDVTAGRDPGVSLLRLLVGVARSSTRVPCPCVLLPCGDRARCMPVPAGRSGDSRGTAAPTTLRPRSGSSQVSRHPHTASSKLGLHRPRQRDDVPVDHLPVDVRAALRLFAFYIANGTLDEDLMEGIDYRPQLMAFGSSLEQVFAIFANVLEVDESGEVLNQGDAQFRAAQWVRLHCDPTYQVVPPFEPWETELH